MLELRSRSSAPFQVLKALLSFFSVAPWVSKILSSFRLADGLNLWPLLGQVTFLGYFNHSIRSEWHNIVPSIRAWLYAPWRSKKALIELEFANISSSWDGEEDEMWVKAGGRGVMGPCDTNQEPISTVSAPSPRRLRPARTHCSLKLPCHRTPPPPNNQTEGNLILFPTLKSCDMDGSPSENHVMPRKCMMPSLPIYV